MAGSVSNKISESAINTDERAVIEKYGFNVGAEGSHFVLTDPEYRKQNKGKGGRHEGGNISILLNAAVAQRKSLEQSAKAPSDQVDHQAARSKNEKATERRLAHQVSENKGRSDPPKTKVAGNGNIPETDAPSKVGGDDTGAASTQSRDNDTSNVNTPASAAETRKDAVKPARVKLEKAAKEPKAPKEKKERVKKVREPKVRKDVRYVRAFREISSNLQITPEALSAKAGVKSHAATWIDVWNTVVKILDERKALAVPAADLTCGTAAK